MKYSDFIDLDELYNDFNKITLSMLKRYNFPIEIKQLTRLFILIIFIIIAYKSYIILNIIYHYYLF